jgi:hypothetical protein
MPPANLLRNLPTCYETRTTTVWFSSWHLVVHKWALCWVGVVLGADDGQPFHNPLRVE